jgi:hypothetical protein
MSTTTPPWQADVITTPPTIESEHARIWFMPLLERHEFRHAGVALWLIEAAWAHPFWHSYVMSLVHLRSEEGREEPKIYIPGATHEMVLMAADPQYARQPMMDTLDFRLLSPPNFAAQMVMPDDDAAMANVERAMPLIAKGELSPDTDFIAQWVAMFGDSMLREKTTKH